MSPSQNVASEQSAPLSLAFVGIGRQGSRHLGCAERMRRSANLRLAAIVDADPHCRKHAERLQVPFFADVDQLPMHVDAAVVATPTCTHLDVGRRLLERDIDLLIEKPVACGLAETEALVRLAERRECIFQVGYLERYRHDFRVRKPDFSSPARIASHRSTRGVAIRTVEELVLELMIHDLDMLATWLDRVPESFAWVNIEHGVNRVCAELDLRFSAGHRARLVAQSGVSEVIRRTRVCSGSAEWDFDWGHDGLRGGSQRAAEPGSDPISTQLRAFVHAVRTRSQPQINGQSALKAMRLAERAIQALPAYA